jgi:hypothetical protein
MDKDYIATVTPHSDYALVICDPLSSRRSESCNVPSNLGVDPQTPTELEISLDSKT